MEATQSIFHHIWPSSRMPLQSININADLGGTATAGFVPATKRIWTTQKDSETKLLTKWPAPGPLPAPQAVQESFQTPFKWPTPPPAQLFGQTWRESDSVSSCSNTTHDEYEDALSDDDPLLDVEHLTDARLAEYLADSFDEYSADALQYMLAKEAHYMPKWMYMQKQPDMTYAIRTVLVDWMLEVLLEFKMSEESLFLSVNYLDRFLSSMAVKKDKLQLLGTTCMFVATKFEEVCPPYIVHFALATNDSYSTMQIRSMEDLLLQTLAFECAAPTAYYFANQFAQLSDLPRCSPACSLALYLCELTLLDGKTFMHMLPSLIAAAAVALARFTHGMCPWTDNLATHSGYTFSDLSDCFIDLHQAFIKAENMEPKTVYLKYQMDKYNRVSLLKPPPIFKGSDQ